jgi:hypothetical protein
MKIEFNIDKKSLTQFNRLMTSEMQKAVGKAYSQALRAMGTGCVRNVTKRLKGRKRFEDVLKKKIDYAPKKAGRIEQLDPMRIAIGVNGTKSQPPALKGKPFPVEFEVGGQNVEARVVKGIARHMARAKYDPIKRGTYPIFIIATGMTDARPLDITNRMIQKYVADNHEKIIERAIGRAIERTDGK